MQWITYKLEGSTLNENYVTKGSDYVRFNYPCTDTASCYPYFVTLIPGKYKFECYGASGGDGKVSAGGKGGYSVGSILLDKTTNFYIYIGGQGSSKDGSADSKVPGGYNGGGIGIVGDKGYKTGGVLQT